MLAVAAVSVALGLARIAARLQSAAAAGTVVIGETTYAEVREHVDVDPLEPLAVKGRAQPVRAYVLRGVSTDSGYAAPSGRDGEERATRR